MRFLDTAISQPIFFDPQSAWLRHGPFAMWLVGILRPRRIVELGTHNGYSYFAFCQAVKEHRLSSTCIAVDTWMGDEHAGFYGDEVYEAVVQRNASYADFSTLLRKTFDAALEDIEDGSVDLLHVDGRHFYDDVKADFESWIPKLSSRAVVLFHDTEVRERGFGVWRYWAEISQNRPALNFPHEHGLGVLFWGQELQNPDDGNNIARLIRLLDTDGVREAMIAAFVLAGEDSVRRHIFGEIGDVAPEHLPALMIDYIEQLSRARTEQTLLYSKIHELNQRIIQTEDERMNLELELVQSHKNKADLEHKLAQARENEARQRFWMEDMDARLRKARRRPWKLVGSLLAFRVLKLLSRAAPPLPVQMAEKFARSARKRNPKISPLPFPDSTGTTLPAQTLSLEQLREQVRISSEANLQDFLASPEQIILQAPNRPRVTVIIVLWNQAPLTLACLQSLAGEVSIPMEVIIVDNASSDQTAQLLERVQNARIIRQSDNIGFLRGVNTALSEARGGHVLLLNNDATLRPGSLLAAVDAIESATDIGAVGGPIILPNGALQEAGSIIWNDGTCLGYGRDSAPDRGPYMFRREVDYCSGAFLLIREGLFQELGGFDEAYAPAYYEETDLCMRLRAEGYRILYEPRAIIDHFEFGSSTKVSTALNLQNKNRRTFCDKHASALSEGHLAPSEANVLRARMRDNRSRILFVEDRVPLLDAGGGLPRANEILRLMAEAGFFVTFLPSTSPNESWMETWATVPEGVEVAMNVGLAGLEAFLEERTGYYQQIFISRPHNMEKLAEITKRRPELFVNTKIIYDAEAIFASRDLGKAELFSNACLRKRALKNMREEVALAQNAQHVTAVNAAEAESFKRINGPSVSVLGHALPLAPTTASFHDRQHVVFLGNLAHDDTPNTDSYAWFVDEVMPHLGDVFEGSTRFLVAGHSGAASVRSRISEKIDLLGPVADLPSLFNRSRVFVAPTRYAAGIPHKVHHAASLGVPIVVTSLLARQLGWKNEHELLVADTAEDFAAAVSRLFHDPELWEAIRSGALNKVAEDCNPEKFREDLLRVLAGDTMS